MDAWLAALPLESIGVVGLVTFVGIAVIRGWLVPATTVGQLTKMRDDRILELVAERADLRAALTVKDEALREVSMQNAELLELGRTGNLLMKSLVEATGRTMP